VADSRRPSIGRVAAIAVVLVAVANILGLGLSLSPQSASAATATTGTVSITPSCYDVGLGQILAVLTSPLGPVVSASGSFSAWATGPDGVPYGGQVSLTNGVAAIFHVFPGSYDVQLSAHDSRGTTYSFSGTVAVPDCHGAFVGIQADPDPDGGYLTFTNTAAVLSEGPLHFLDHPSFLVTDPHAPIVGLGAVPNQANADSYYFAAADGGVFTVNAPFYGSAAGLSLDAPVVAMALTPDDGGYWLVGADGGVFAFGDAQYYGSLGGRPLSQPIVGMTVDQTTGGYWLVGRDGSVFAFHAPFYGSAATLHLNAPVVGMESAPGGTGYRLVASDGGVFSYDEPFDGSMAGQHLAAPVVGIAEDPVTGGYWIASSDGGVFAFGAPFYGAEGVSAS
jgi:hypothetical protein